MFSSHILLSNYTKGKTLAAKKDTNAKEEISRLRAENNALKNALNEITSCADEHMKVKSELVWFALNRTRYPTHPTSKHIETSESHRGEIEKLRSNDCDFHHGFNFGVLASSRLFKNITEIVKKAENSDDLSEKQKEVENVKRNFPDLSVNSTPPKITSA